MKVLLGFEISNDWNSYSNAKDLLNFFPLFAPVSPKTIRIPLPLDSKTSMASYQFSIEFYLVYFGSKTFTSKITFRFENIQFWFRQRFGASVNLIKELKRRKKKQAQTLIGKQPWHLGTCVYIDWLQLIFIFFHFRSTNVFFFFG